MDCSELLSTIALGSTIKKIGKNASCDNSFRWLYINWLQFENLERKQTMTKPRFILGDLKKHLRPNNIYKN